MLCECMKPAAINFLRLNEQEHSHHLSGDFNLVDYFLSNQLRNSNRLRSKTVNEFAALPIFHSQACHICNRRVPSIRWSNLGEHSVFVQHFGWYFYYALYAAGISPYGEILKGALDGELQSILTLDQKEVWAKIRELTAPKTLWYGALDGPPTVFDSPGVIQARELNRHLKQQRKAAANVIEDRLRLALGFPAQKKTGFSERLLHWIVAALFGPNEVLFRSKPPFLNGLELDVYVPALSLGIEYQGEQHYAPFEHLGGQKHFRGVKRRDRLKAKLCKEAGIHLEYFSLADKLTEDFVAARFKKFVPPVQAK